MLTHSSTNTYRTKHTLNFTLCWSNWYVPVFVLSGQLGTASSPRHFLRYSITILKYISAKLTCDHYNNIWNIISSSIINIICVYVSKHISVNTYVDGYEEEDSSIFLFFRMSSCSICHISRWTGFICQDDISYVFFMDTFLSVDQQK